MAKEYLDKTGLTYFFGKLKDVFQLKLVSGTNIKTINNESVLGSGNISVSGSSADDYVTEQGTSGIWTYRKWNSGIAECWGTCSERTVTSWSTWGSLYYCNPYNVADAYPTGLFISTPSCQAQISTSSSDCFLIKNNNGSATQTAAFYLGRGTSVTGTFKYTLAYYAVGKWK